jgi:hypothetical protein
MPKRFKMFGSSQLLGDDFCRFQPCQEEVEGLLLGHGIVSEDLQRHVDTDLLVCFESEVESVEVDRGNEGHAPIFLRVA